MTVEFPKASISSLIIAVAVNLCIFLGCICYVLANDRLYFIEEHGCHNPVCNNDPNLCPGKEICEPGPVHVLHTIEDAILYIFTIEYAVRFFTVWFVNPRLSGVIHEHDHDDEHEHEESHSMADDPYIHPLWRGAVYLTEWKNIIDIATIVPFYVFLDPSIAGGGTSFNFIRVLRLTRVLHVFKLTKDNQILNLLERTMVLSAPGMFRRRSCCFVVYIQSAMPYISDVD